MVHYGGTWAADKMVHIIRKKDGIFIVNSDESTSSGSHWSAIWKKRGKVEYFCSYGLEHVNDELRELLERLGYKRNGRQLQSLDSDLCGQYCILYLICRERGNGYTKFLNCFTENYRVNDAIVEFVYGSIN